MTTREKIIEVLEQGEGSIREIAAAAGCTVSATRSQITNLERDGVVQVIRTENRRVCQTRFNRSPKGVVRPTAVQIWGLRLAKAGHVA